MGTEGDTGDGGGQRRMLEADRTGRDSGGQQGIGDMGVTWGPSG